MDRHAAVGSQGGARGGEGRGGLDAPRDGREDRHRGQGAHPPRRGTGRPPARARSAQAVPRREVTRRRAPPLGARAVEGDERGAHRGRDAPGRGANQRAGRRRSNLPAGEVRLSPQPRHGRRAARDASRTRGFENQTGGRRGGRRAVIVARRARIVTRAGGDPRATRRAGRDAR